MSKTAQECPLEQGMETLLRESGIRFVRPERIPGSHIKLDFWLPDFDLFIELKQFPTPRLDAQLEPIDPTKNVMVLIGRNSLWAFQALVMAISTDVKEQ